MKQIHTHSLQGQKQEMTSISLENLIHKTDRTAPFGSEPQRALVVDDDPMMLEVVSRMLETLGFQVDSAKGGIAAFGWLCQNKYSVVVTDMQMTDINGYSLACWLKEKTKFTKIIIMTGQSRSDVMKYMKVGIADCWMFKPFSLNELGGAVHELLMAEVS